MIFIIIIIIIIITVHARDIFLCHLCIDFLSYDCKIVVLLIPYLSCFGLHHIT